MQQSCYIINSTQPIKDVLHREPTANAVRFTCNGQLSLLLCDNASAGEHRPYRQLLCYSNDDTCQFKSNYEKCCCSRVDCNGMGCSGTIIGSILSSSKNYVQCTERAKRRRLSNEAICTSIASRSSWLVGYCDKYAITAGYFFAMLQPPLMNLWYGHVLPAHIHTNVVPSNTYMYTCRITTCHITCRIDTVARHYSATRSASLVMK